MINEVINMNILNELNEACDYIENNICKDIEIDELAIFFLKKLRKGNGN